MELDNVGLHQDALRWNAFQLQGTGRRQADDHLVTVVILEGIEVPAP